MPKSNTLSRIHQFNRCPSYLSPFLHLSLGPQDPWVAREEVTLMDLNGHRSPIPVPTVRR